VVHVHIGSTHADSVQAQQHLVWPGDGRRDVAYLDRPGAVITACFMGRSSARASEPTAVDGIGRAGAVAACDEHRKTKKLAISSGEAKRPIGALSLATLSRCCFQVASVPG